MKKTVLCFLFSGQGDERKLLMIEKKRGQGAGKWNVPGGKLHPQETAIEAAKRECEEETGLIPENLSLVGQLEFYFPQGNSWDNDCSVFVSEAHKGHLLEESDESKNAWVLLKNIPWEKLWSSDRIWLPLLLKGEKFHRRYVFDANDQVIEEQNLYTDEDK